MTDCLNQRDRRPVVNTSSLHSAKTRAKTKQKKLTQKQTKIHRVTTDMCGITNSSTCFSLEAQRWDVQQFSLTSGRPSSGHQEKFHSTKTFRHFLPSWELHHSKTNHLIAEVPFPERYVWPRAVTSHHPILTGVSDEPLQTFCHCHSNQERRYETSTYAVCRTT